MKKILGSKILLSLSFLVTAQTFAALEKTSQPWRLSSFMELAAQNPARLLRVANGLFSKHRILRVSADSSLAFEWQDRLAMVSALSMFFDSSYSKKITPKQLAHARRLITHALHNDPALFVRDGAVESIRRIMRMQPADTAYWRSDLEKAFLDRKNILEKEGFFIRETILTTMREGSLRPSAHLIKEAKLDKNTKVREHLKLWETQAFDSLKN